MNIKNVTDGFRGKIRAAGRIGAAVLLLPILAALTFTQIFVVGPIFKNKTKIPNLVYSVLRKLCGYKVVFNKASQPIVKNKPVWFISNHIAEADFLPFGGKISGIFIGKGEVLKWPIISIFARAVDFIGLRRASKYNPQSKAKIIKNFNQGNSAIMFPEGTTTSGRELRMFRASLFSILYGGTGIDKMGEKHKLKKEVIVQPVALRVLSVGGKNALCSDELYDIYGMRFPDKAGYLKSIWRILQIKNTTLELTILPPLNPKDFPDEKALVNRAAVEIVRCVNPSQKKFKRYAIPKYIEK